MPPAERSSTEPVAQVLGSVRSPMAVVTVRADDGEASGCLVGFFTQCSIDPPRLVGAILERSDVEDHTAHLVEVVAASGVPVADALTMVDAEDIEPGHPA